MAVGTLPATALLVGCSSSSAGAPAYEDLFVGSTETVTDDELGIYALDQINGRALEVDRDRFRFWLEEDFVHLAVECADGRHVGVTAAIELDRDEMFFRTLEDHEANVTLADGEKCGLELAWSAGVSYSFDGRTLILDGPINRLLMEKLSDR